MVALNQPFGDTPLITEAGLAAATQMTLPNGDFGVPGGQSSGRSTRLGPIDGGSITGGGSANLVVVPNIIGLTLAQASPIIAGVGLALGVVTIQNTQTGSLVPSIIRSAYAQHCQSDTILTQTPAAGTLVSPGTQITVVLCGQDAQVAAVSEPPSLILFAAGLGLLILFTWSRRRLG